MNIASIDIGTNTVILLIVKITDGKFMTLHNEFRIPRIGGGLKSGGKITDEKIRELLKVLSEYKLIIKKYNCSQIIAIATNAFRIATNSNNIVALVKNETGIEIEIIAGDEEAEYSFLGAVLGLSNQNGDVLVIDIGGGSTELIYGRSGKIFYKNSFPIGVVIETERFFKHNPPLNSEVDYFVDNVNKTFEGIPVLSPVITIAIAGTPTTLACIKQGLKIYNEDLVEGLILKSDDIWNLRKELSELSSIQIKDKYKAIVTGREDVLLAGTIILFELMKLLNISDVVVSTKGIRYGVVYKKYINLLSENKNI
jgi:exopolyphosphatase/guanosine-5'-triphosphate,3'-diphosphate pyrophosphatase